MIDWGMFALGLFIGIVGTATAMLAFVIVECVEYELFKDTHASPLATQGKSGTSNQQPATRNE